MCEKHPALRVVVESAFLPCDVFPLLIDLDITADYVECVAQHIQRSVGLGGSTALWWHGYLLWYGVSSVHLWDAVAMLICHLANGLEIVGALMASCLIALDKFPEVRLFILVMLFIIFYVKLLFWPLMLIRRRSVVLLSYVLDYEQVWKEQFMLCMNFLISTVMIFGGFCMLMQCIEFI